MNTLTTNDGGLTAVCQECGKRWTPRKGDPDNYPDGLRCADPDCRSRNVELIEPTESEPVPAQAFRRFREGDGPLELVEAGLCDPDEARELAAEFSELSEYHVVPEDELAEHVKAEREEVREAAQERIEALRERATRRVEAAERHSQEQLNQKLTAARQRAFDRGHRQGHAEGFEDGLEAGVEEGRREGYEEAMAQAEARLEEFRDQYEETISELKDELDRSRAERVWLADALRDYQSGDVGAIYSLGYSDGVIAGVAEGHREGKADGMLETARILAH